MLFLVFPGSNSANRIIWKGQRGSRATIPSSKKAKASKDRPRKSQSTREVEITMSKLFRQIKDPTSTLNNRETAKNSATGPGSAKDGSDAPVQRPGSGGSDDQSNR